VDFGSFRGSEVAHGGRVVRHANGGKCQCGWPGELTTPWNRVP
jgi:hypothetical protein